MLYLFAAILLLSGVYHLVDPAFYDPLMPDWMPKRLANYAAGIAELVIAVLLVLPDWRLWGIRASLVLMILFLPLHVLDLWRDPPVVGSPGIAVMRLVIQVALIGWLAWEWRRQVR
jgi:uncharacterized membrane protein